MKKSFILLAFLTSIFFYSNLNATSFSLIDSSFHISGSIQTTGMIDPPNFYGGYSENSSSPLVDNLVYYRSSAYSQASFEKVEARHVAINDEKNVAPYGNTVASAYASTEVLFKPNFSGEGDPITFLLWAINWGGPAYASIRDLNTEDTIFFETTHPNMSVTKVLSYSEWDPDHIYRLAMTANSGPGSAFDDGGAFVSNDMSFVFVPEPTTMLLLGLGLIGLGVFKTLKNGLNNPPLTPKYKGRVQNNETIA